jgi:hypothetical protein
MYCHGGRCKPLRRLDVFLELPAAAHAAAGIFFFSKTMATSTEVCLSSREELCLVELQWEQPVSANDAEFWPRDMDRRSPQPAPIARGLLILIALGLIAAIALRVGASGKATEAKEADAARVGMHPCLAGLRHDGWRHSDQLQALCAR